MHPNDPRVDDSPAAVERLEGICEKLCNMEIGNGQEAVVEWLQKQTVPPGTVTKYVEDGIFPDALRLIYYEDRFNDPDMQEQIEQEIASENERGYEDEQSSYQGRD